MSSPGPVLTAAEFEAVFVAGWAKPKPAGFLEHFLPLLAPDAVFTQPNIPDARGPAQVEQVFRRLFALLPDLTTTVRRAAVVGDAVLLESGCAATLAGRPVAFDTVDRFVLRDGLIAERRSFSDPTPVLLAALRHPSAWRRAAAARRPLR